MKLKNGPFFKNLIDGQKQDSKPLKILNSKSMKSITESKNNEKIKETNHVYNIKQMQSNFFNRNSSNINEKKNNFSDVKSKISQEKNCNLMISKLHEKLSKEKSKKYSNITNISNNLSTQTNFPEIKTEKLLNSNKTNNNNLLNFFKPLTKKNAIKLKKDNNLERINRINQYPNYISNEKTKLNISDNLNATLKYPKKPITVDYGIIKNIKINDNSKKSFDKSKENKNNIIENCKKNIKLNDEESKNDSKISNIVNFAHRTNNEDKILFNPNLKSYLKNIKKPGDNELNISKKNKDLILIKASNTSGGFKDNFKIKENFTNSIYKKNILTLKNSENSKMINFKKKNFCQSKSELNSNDLSADSTFSPHNVQNNFSTLNSGNLKKIGISLNHIQSKDNLENKINDDLNVNVNHNILKKEQVINNETIENLNNNNNLKLISNEIIDFKCNQFSSSYYTPTTLNNHNKKFFSPLAIENFFSEDKMNKSMDTDNTFNENNIKLKNNCYLSNNQNDDKIIHKNFISNSNNLKSEKAFNKINNSLNSKLILKRPRTVNSNFKFSDRIDQDLKRSIQDILDMPMCYFPFSKKRDKISQIEKQSYIFQDRVQKELKDVKKSIVKKVNIKSKNKLSNYLMRDYFIGEKCDPVNSSK